MYLIKFSRRSDKDVDSIYCYIAGLGFPENAAGFTDQLLAYCYTLRTFPKRGTPQPSIAEGIRIVGFHHQVEIAFRICDGDRTVTIVRILYGKQALERAFRR